MAAQYDATALTAQLLSMIRAATSIPQQVWAAQYSGSTGTITLAGRALVLAGRWRKYFGSSAQDHTVMTAGLPGGSTDDLFNGHFTETVPEASDGPSPARLLT